MLSDFAPALKDISECFLKNIFGILSIKADHFGCAQKRLLVLLEPEGKFDLIARAHRAILEGER